MVVSRALEMHPGSSGTFAATLTVLIYTRYVCIIMIVILIMIIIQRMLILMNIIVGTALIVTIFVIMTINVYMYARSVNTS